MKHFLAFSLVLAAVALSAPQICFSPDGACEKPLVAFIHGAKKSLDVAVYDINEPTIVQELIDKNAVMPVRVVVDDRQSKGPHSQVGHLVQAGVPVRYGHQPGGIMHDKFTIVDGQALETGSFNYTNHASHQNQENQIYLTDAEVVAAYAKRFEKMWAEAKPVPQPTAARVTPHNPRDVPHRPLLPTRDFIHEKAESGEQELPEAHDNPHYLPGLMTLHQKQALFAQLAAKLVEHAQEMGYEVTLGEAWRSQAAASFPLLPTQYYADHGKGVANSLHIQRLAIDLNLFKDGKLLEQSEDYRALGEWWEQQHPLARWGGRFKHLSDGNHFSLQHENVQ